MPRGLAPDKRSCVRCNKMFSSWDASDRICRRCQGRRVQLSRKAQKEIAEDEEMILAIEAHRESSLEELIEIAYPSVIDGPPDAVEVTLCPAI